MTTSAPATYRATLDFLYNSLPMFSRIGVGAFKKDLTNIKALCKKIDNPQQQFKSIHIAGTNGKGSVSYMLAAILQQSGYKTGLYTSPHLKDFRERIRINGIMITEEFVAEFIGENFTLINNIQPSFFEITVAMAFAWFAENKCDVAVVEVGLGGRLDSTNIIQPELSVITNISYDHQQILGNTLKEIAGEKAGIIKPGIPVVIGETHEETKPVFIQKAAQCKSPIIFADKEWKIIKKDFKFGKLIVELHPINDLKHQPVTYTLDLTGAYQLKNILTVLTSVKELKELQWHIDEKDVLTALSSVKELTGLRGRWEIINEHPLTIADVAHNEGGIREVMQQVKQLSFRRLHIVTGFVKDKAIESILKFFPRDASYYFSQADIPRALPADELASVSEKYGLKGAAYLYVKDALAAAQKEAGEDDLVLVCGSVFVVAEVLA